jgi:Protein of unknown function (DUF1573)
MAVLTKRMVCLAVLMLLLSLCTSVAVVLHRTRNDRGVGLVCDDSAFNFGEVDVSRAGSLEHHFILYNRSAKTVRIIDSSVSCGCTSVVAKGQSVPPDREVEIPVTVNWVTHRGRVSSTIALFTDSTETPKIFLDVFGDIESSATVDPVYVDFGDLDPGEVTTRPINIACDGSIPDFQITSVKIAGQHIHLGRAINGIESVGRSLSGPAGEFLLSIAAPRTGGQENSRVIFQTNIQSPRELILSVVANFKPAILADPQALLFEYDSRRAGQTGKTLTLQSTALAKSFRSMQADISATGGLNSGFVVRNSALLGDPRHPKVELRMAFVNLVGVQRGYVRRELKVTLGADSINIPLIAIDVSQPEAASSLKGGT